MMESVAVALVVALVVLGYLRLRPVRCAVSHFAVLLGYLGALIALGWSPGRVAWAWLPAAVVASCIGITVGRAQSHLTRRVAALDQTAHADALTGLPNRKTFLEQAGWALGLAKRTNQRVAVLLIDLDHFKEINDTLGHHMGDTLLQMVGPRMRSVLRSTDVIARLGGDEFAVLLPEVCDAAAALSVAHKLVAALVEPFTAPNRELQVGASIGVAVYPQHGESLDVLLQRADVAMYRSKYERNTATLYAAALDQEQVLGLGLTAELQRAAELDQIDVRFQPTLELVSGRIVSLLAEPVWRHPQLGVIAGAELSTIAQPTETAIVVTQRVLAAAVGQCMRMLERGIRLRVAVRVSGAVFAAPDFHAGLARLLSSVAMPADLLVLALPEDAVMGDPESARVRCRELRSFGVWLAMTDFGAGCSSPTVLGGLGFEEIHVAARLTQEFTAGSVLEQPISGAGTVLAATIRLGAALAGAVIVEGVDDATSLRMLRSVGCTSVRGAAVSAPVASGRLENWLGLRAQSSPGQRVIGMPTPLCQEVAALVR
jgi:diguanylate cyclase